METTILISWRVKKILLWPWQFSTTCRNKMPKINSCSSEMEISCFSSFAESPTCFTKCQGENQTCIPRVAKPTHSLSLDLPLGCYPGFFLTIPATKEDLSDAAGCSRPQPKNPEETKKCFLLRRWEILLGFFGGAKLLETSSGGTWDWNSTKKRTSQKPQELARCIVLPVSWIWPNYHISPT